MPASPQPQALPPGSPGRVLLGPQNLVPLGAAAIVLSVLVGTTWAASERVGDIVHSIEKLDQRTELRLRSIDDRIGGLADSMKDRWTRADMTIWVELLRARNPDLVVPDPTRGS